MMKSGGSVAGAFFAVSGFFVEFVVKDFLLSVGVLSLGFF